MLRIKTITEPQGNRCYVTIEETDVSGIPTGRMWTEPFDAFKKNWAELKARFKSRIAKANAKAVIIATLINEAEDAKLTSIT